MATKIKFKPIESGFSVSFLDDKGKMKKATTHEVYVNGKYVETRRVHTGNSNYIPGKETVVTYIEKLEKDGVVRSTPVKGTKDIMVYHPIMKHVRRVLHAIR